MRILFVAMSDSVHAARWIGQIADQGWDLHLFPSVDHGSVHPELPPVKLQRSWYERIGAQRESFIARGINYSARRVISRFFPNYRAGRLARLIRNIRPDIVHALEFQAAGYLCLEAKRRLGGDFPAWIATNWGSDLYLFGRLKSHRARVAEVLAACDFYSCECERDVALARAFGLVAPALPVLPNSGGFDLDAALPLRAPGPTSRRRGIVLKGYQHWAGRALTGLRALERCADLLTGYEISVFSASEDVALAAELFSQRTRIPVRIVPGGASNRDILALHGNARISIGLSISDAISTSLLEAMIMGSFPVQSSTACADEWIEDGRSGLIVPPEDPEQVEQALRRALFDDALVDDASAANLRTARLRLDRHVLKPKILDFYARVAKAAG
jgi:glycosyltransferase involved in cell wall biosynthesis